MFFGGLAGVFRGLRCYGLHLEGVKTGRKAGRLVVGWCLKIEC